MSERWIEYEEQMAAALTAVDSCLRSVEHSEKQTQGTCSCANSEIHITSAEPGPSSEATYMGHLDSTCLTVLESIIRESHSEDVDIEQTMLLEQGSGILLPAETHDLESEFQGRHRLFVISAL